VTADHLSSKIQLIFHQLDASANLQTKARPLISSYDSKTLAWCRHKKSLFFERIKIGSLS